MFSDDELNLALAVMAAAALVKGDLPAAPVWPWPAEAVGPVAAPVAAPAGVRPARRAVVEHARMCVIFSVDIAGFTDARRDDEVQLALRRALYRLLIDSFEASGVPWDDCVHEDRGDGVIVIVPPEIPAIIMIDPLLHHMRAALRRHNRLSNDIARIELRVAVHLGQVHHDEYGLAGTAVNHLFRMLDAPVLRAALAATGGELALIVSQHFYDSVIRQQPSMIEPTEFRPVVVKVKKTRIRGWIWTPAPRPAVAAPPPVRWWMMPVGAISMLLWGGGVALMADADLGSLAATGFAIGVTAVTGVAITATMIGLMLRAATGAAAGPARLPSPGEDGSDGDGSGGDARRLRAVQLGCGSGRDDMDRRAG